MGVRTFRQALQTLLGAASLRRRIAAVALLLVLFNLVAWSWAWLALRTHPALLGTALLAYGFGLRHAVDADHIAAIDNVTRKLMQDGRRPVTIGLMFSLGHSTVVWLMTIAVALGQLALGARFEAFKAFGSVAGTLVSCLSLLAIAAMNGVSLLALVRAWRGRRGDAAQAGGQGGAHNAGNVAGAGGLLARLLRPLFGLIGKSWHMYPLGLLFGLGFDTATEIGLMGISATTAAQDLPLSAIFVFPLLFTAGMTLIDTADGILMLGAYGWAFVKPARKIYYNVIILSLSIALALVVGGIEALGLLADRLALKGAPWDAVATLNGSFGLLGYAIVAVFAACWMGSVLFHRWRGLAAPEAGDGARSDTA